MKFGASLEKTRTISSLRRNEPQAAVQTVAFLQHLISANWIFYLWLPVTVGLFMSTTEASRTEAWPVALRTLYFVAICCLDWWIVDLGCRVCARLMRPLRANFYVVLLCGSIAAAMLLVQPANLLFIQVWNNLMSVQRVLPSLADPGMTGLSTDLVAGLVPWLLASVSFYRLGKTSRYGFVPPQLRQTQHGASSQPVPNSPEPAFMSKVRPERQGKLLALNAQGHYLRVITTSGEDLVLHRFGDALSELPDAAGLQVHRSWWVSAAALADGRDAGPRKLGIGEDLVIPVSRTYQRELVARRRQR